LTNQVRDARRFILYHKWVIENSPLQVYASALVFSPTRSLMREAYKQEEPEWITTKPIIEDHWNACLQMLEGHSDGVMSVTFSHDSKLLASASYDKTVRIWDVGTGFLQQTLEGHSDGVMSVAFSHDSKLLASASYDETVRIWDVSTSFCHQIVTVNTVITSLSFDSIDSNLLTNVGSCKVYRTELSTTSEYSQEGGSDGDRQRLSISGPWVTWNKQNLLWLPPDYRATMFDISLLGSIVAGGCESGKVFIIGFSPVILYNSLGQL